ncbi:MAG TPA: hypothetical protein PKH07_11130, partial [bacterium]|nr:hypothetical protein [bacterium]
VGLPLLPQHLSREEYLRRVAQQALETLEGTSVCPSLLIEPTACQLSEANPRNLPVHAVLFEWFPHFTNEFYSLAVDAFSSDLDHSGKPRRLVVAAHESWLTEDGRWRRGLWWTGLEDDLLIESDIEPSLSPLCVQTICAPPEAHSRIHDWCVRHSISQVNPYPISAVADDKYECFLRWKESGVPTPETRLIQRGTPKQKTESLLAEWISQTARDNPDCCRDTALFIQPNLGTEGRDVCVYTVPSGFQDAVQRITAMAVTEPVIVRPSCGNIYWRDDSSGAIISCVLRVNVGFDGTEHRAESGYLQVASSPGESVVSAGRGGHVVEFRKGALESLVTAEGKSVVLDAESIRTLKMIAANAAQTIGGVGLFGVDLRLEVTASPQAPRSSMLLS